MSIQRRWICFGFLSVLMGLCSALYAQQATPSGALEVDWDHVVIVSRSTPTLQVVVNPELLPGAHLHDSSFKVLKELGADYVRYVPWLPYPKLAVPELEAPRDAKTSWDFSHIDPMLDDFMKATEGHSVILNFSTIPAWMFKTEKPVAYPSDPNEVTWQYTQGSQPRDPSMKEFAHYFARLLSWYEKGGFKDEYGAWHASGHHYKIAYWEVLNELDLEHHWTPEMYTKFYDVVTAAMLKVDPNLKFMSLAMAHPGNTPEMFEYFLNPAHHSGGAPIDFISYHFYGQPEKGETLVEWQYTLFAQEEGFLNTVRYVEQIRKRYSPQTKTDLNELGVILPDDKPGATEMLEPPGYWNLAAAMYADLYIQLTKLGIEVVGESQLVGYPSQFPSVTMMNYVTAAPNARFWALKLLKDHFGPGDRLMETRNADSDLSVQAFQTSKGKSILVVNKRLKSVTLTLPSGFQAGHIQYVAPSTGDDPPSISAISGQTVDLEPNEVAVITQ